MLHIEKVQEEGNTKFILEGRLDTLTAPELEMALKDTLEQPGNLELDLENLEYISSAGLRVLLAAQKAIAANGELKVTHVNEEVMDIFEVTGFSDILTIE